MPAEVSLITAYKTFRDSAVFTDRRLDALISNAVPSSLTAH